jgi:hypothetical protein
VVVTPPIEVVGAVDTVPPIELVVVSRVVVVTFDVVVAPTVVVVAPVVVVGLTVVVVAPVVVVGFTVVVVAPVMVVGLTVVVVALLVVVVPPVVVVVAPVVEVAPEVVVDSSLVVVVVPPDPPEVVADASWATLTPANTIMAIMISQVGVRLRTFLTCLAIDPYLPLSPRRASDDSRIPGQTRQPRPLASLLRRCDSPGPGVPDLAMAAADRRVCSWERSGWAAAAGWAVGDRGKAPLLDDGGPPQETAGNAGHDTKSGVSNLIERQRQLSRYTQFRAVCSIAHPR